jgi:hypothetical protein
MKLKTLIVSVVILALLSGIAYWANRPETSVESDARVSKTLVEASAVDKAAKIRISDQGKTVVLERQTDGSWHDASYYDMPADFSKLSSLVGDLTSAKIQRLVTTNPARLSRLEFKDTKVDLLDASDRTILSLVLGKNADSGGRFLRFGDESKAYLAILTAYIDADPKNWADAQLLSVKPDDVAKIELSFDQGVTPPTGIGAKPEEAASPDKSGWVSVAPVTLSRAKKGDAWTGGPTPPGQRVNAEKISSAITSIGALRFSDTTPLDDPQAAIAKAHARTFKLTTFDGKTYTILMGRKPEEKKLKPAEKKPETPPAAAKSPADSGAADSADKKPAAGDAPGSAAAKPATPEKPPEPEYETIPAGPVFAWVTSSDSKAPVNAAMGKRDFQVDDYSYTGLPQKSSELFEPIPATPPPSTAKPSPETPK